MKKSDERSLRRNAMLLSFVLFAVMVFISAKILRGLWRMNRRVWADYRTAHCSKGRAVRDTVQGTIFGSALSIVVVIVSIELFTVPVATDDLVARGHSGIHVRMRTYPGEWIPVILQMEYEIVNTSLEPLQVEVVSVSSRGAELVEWMGVLDQWKSKRGFTNFPTVKVYSMEGVRLDFISD